MGMNSRERKRSSVKETANSSPDSKSTSNETEKSKKDKEQNEKKKIWSFDALVEAMKPSDEELEYRKEKRKEFNAVQENSKLFQCTTCQKSFETIIKKHEKVPIHPCLGVLMCQKCCEYYEDGEFSLDSEGEDKYCRWCGEGGTIFGCSKCICGFCAKCIKRHFKPQFYKQVQKDDNWLCFFCDPKPLWDHRFKCSLAVEMSNGQETLNNSPDSNKTEEENSKLDSKCNDSNQSLSFENLVSKFKSGKKNSAKRMYSSSSDEMEHGRPESHNKKLKSNTSSLEGSSNQIEHDLVENLKSDVLKELERILKVTENQMNFGLTWSKKTIKNISSLDSRTSQNELVIKCQKIKSFLSVFSAHLSHLSNSADSLEKMLCKNGQKTPLDSTGKEKSSFTTIQQFLGFINNQVKTFMEKGISLSDVLEAEVYDDVNVIGIKKKFKSSGNSFNQNKNINPTEISESFRSEDNDDTESKEDTDELKIDDDEVRSTDGSDSDKVTQTNSETNFKESDDECKDLNNSNVTSLDLNELKCTGDKDDIQEILAILENA